VQEGDEYYIRMVSEKLKSFGAEDWSDKVVHSCGKTVKKHQVNSLFIFSKTNLICKCKHLVALKDYIFLLTRIVVCHTFLMKNLCKAGVWNAFN
jgi:hypothetical protein